MAQKKILLSWSGGKDSAWALHLLREQKEFEVAALLTTVNQEFHRVAMHGFREELLDAQAEAAGLPLWKVPLPWPCSNEVYEKLMQGVCERALAEGLHGIAFGDLFLEDIRAYRVQKLAGTGLEPIFPVWGIPTDELARTMIAGGLRAHLSCVNPGREFNAQLLADFPEGVDPCGERGEFHSYVFAGPMFSHAIDVEYTHTVLRDGFAFADLVPVRLT